MQALKQQMDKLGEVVGSKKLPKKWQSYSLQQLQMQLAAAATKWVLCYADTLGFDVLLTPSETPPTPPGCKALKEV